MKIERKREDIRRATELGDGDGSRKVESSGRPTMAAKDWKEPSTPTKYHQQQHYITYHKFIITHQDFQFI